MTQLKSDPPAGLRHSPRFFRGEIKHIPYSSCQIGTVFQLGPITGLPGMDKIGATPISKETTGVPHMIDSLIIIGPESSTDGQTKKSDAT